MYILNTFDFINGERREHIVIRVFLKDKIDGNALTYSILQILIYIEYCLHIIYSYI